MISCCFDVLAFGFDGWKCLVCLYGSSVVDDCSGNDSMRKIRSLNSGVGDRYKYQRVLPERGKRDRNWVCNRQRKVDAENKARAL